MLVFEYSEEIVLQLRLSLVATTGHRYRFAFAGRSVFFNEVFDVVIVDVVCCFTVSTLSIGHRRRQQHSRDVAYGGSKQVLTSVSTSLRIS